MVSSQYAELIRLGFQYAELIRLGFLLGFFGVSALCIYAGRRSELGKQAFVVVLVVGLMIPVTTSVMLPPFATWSFFPHPAPQNTTQYDVVLVNDTGATVEYPEEAAPPGRVYTRASLMINEYEPSERTRMAEYLLHRARIHRRAVADGLTPLERIRFGHLSDEGLFGDSRWTPTDAQRIGHLRGLRVYETTINTSDDGRRITNRSQSLVYEYPENGGNG